MRSELIGINIKLFNSSKNWTTTSFFILILLSLYEFEKNKNYVSYNELKPYANFKRTTFNKQMKIFADKGYLIPCKTYNSSLNRYRRYYFPKIFQENRQLLFVSSAFLLTLINFVNEKKLNKTQFRIFLHLKYKEFKKVNVELLNQSMLAVSMGLTRNAVHIALKNIDSEVISYLNLNFEKDFFYIYCFIC